MGLKIPKINWIPYDNLKDIFFMIGVFVSITLVSVIAITSVIKIRDLISDYRNTKRYEYKIAHRFDNPPLAKCYCIDCLYCFGEPTKTGDGVYCGLFNDRIVIQDNSFCYRAQPKKKKDARND